MMKAAKWKTMNGAHPAPAYALDNLFGLWTKINFVQMRLSHERHGESMEASIFEH